MKEVSKKLKSDLLYAMLFFGLFVVLRFAGNVMFANALCFGFFTALVFSRQNLLFSSIAYGLSGIFSGQLTFLWTMSSLIVVIIVVCLLRAAHKKFTKWWFFAAALCGQVFFIVFETSASVILFQKLGYLFTGIVFAFVSLYTIKSVLIRGLKYKLNADEKICGSVFVVCLALGLSGIEPFGFPMIRVVSCVSILFSLYVFGDMSCLMMSILLGAGSAFGTGILTDVAVFALWGVVAVSFKQIAKPLCVLSIPLCDFVVKYFFQGQLISIEATVALIVGCGIFLLLPSRLLQKWRDKMGHNNEGYAVRSIVNRTKNNLSRKLYDLSEIFFEMKLSFLGMVKGVMPRDQAKIALAREVSETVCRDCHERTNCWRTNMESTEKAFLVIMEGALDRGRATVLDLPNALTARCKRLNNVLSCVNQSVMSYKHYYTVTTNSDNSRMLIGEQLAGVSVIMKNLSEQSKEQSNFDAEKERHLFEQLTYEGILVKEAVVSNERENLYVTIVVEATDSKKNNIGEVVSKVCALSMMLSEKQITHNKNWVVMTFVPSPKLDVTFGFAGVKKTGSEISGDTHTFLRINEHKFLLGLCDGMGSGVQAEKASSTAISLIENFYKAGFDNDTILTSVNKLLSLSQEEVFTAVDISVVNLQDGICDFIKIGAPCGFVKNRNNVEIISAGSLPLGVLEEMKPCITKKAICDGDSLIMVSDGILDAFAVKEDFANLIAEHAMLDPQAFAETLLNAAIEQGSGTMNDDMTVIVAQVFEKDAKI